MLSLGRTNHRQLAVLHASVLWALRVTEDGLGSIDSVVVPSIIFVKLRVKLIVILQQLIVDDPLHVRHVGAVDLSIQFFLDSAVELHLTDERSFVVAHCRGIWDFRHLLGSQHLLGSNIFVRLVV